MKLASFCLLLFSCLCVASAAFADTLVLKNGDHLTGTITAMTSQQITLKTAAAGEIHVKWSAVQQLNSTQPLYVATPQKQTLEGTANLEGADLVIHTATQGDVHIPVAQLTIVRNAEEQQAYEKSLHPSLAENWTIGANVGFALARGNSDTTNLNTAFTADRKTLTDEITMSASTIYARSGVTASGAPGGITANEILGAAAYQKNISPRLFGFVSGNFTHDALQDLVLRSIYSGGLGWHAINRPVTTLDALLGANYTRETYSSGATATAPALNVARNLPGITAGENFMHKFTPTSVATESFNFYPDLSDISQYRFALDAAVVTKIKKWLGWQASLDDRYVSNPPIPGTKSNDVILSTGLNFSFMH